MEYDAVVIGAGVEGSSTAYHLVKNGVKKVLLLEQFYPLHSRGSSHGGSRLTRVGPLLLEPLNNMTKDSIKVYQEMTDNNGQPVSLPVVGIGSFGEKSCPHLQKIADYLRKEHVSQSPIKSASEINRIYCDQVGLPDNFHCVWDTSPTVTILNPSNIVSTFQSLFVKNGGVFLDNHCVTDILPGDKVTVRTNRGDFRARKVVITTGGWAPKLLKNLGVDLPLKVQRAEVLYWKVDHPEKFTADVFPILIYENRLTNDKLYVFPVHEYPGLIKVYYRTTRLIEPDERDLTRPGPESVEIVADFIRRFLKGVSTSPAIFEQCIYTMSPDYLPVIDRVPGSDNIVFAAGMSGIGFKIAPAVGQVLTELVLGRPLSYDLYPFRVDRFTKEWSAKL